MQPRRRLNLFAFPPETNALFSMLIFASIMLALFSGSALRLYWGIENPLTSLDITSQRLELTSASLWVFCLSGIAAVGTLGLAFFSTIPFPNTSAQEITASQ